MDDNGQIPLMLRLEARLHAVVKAEAERDQRSLNREIAVLLLEALEARQSRRPNQGE